MVRSLRFGFVVVSLLGCSLGFGQQKSTHASSPIDTRSFFPQIAEVIISRPITVRHQVALPDGPGIPNNLKAGGLLDEARVLSGGHFPGIGQSGLTPGDPDIAVGPNHVVEVINSQIGFFTKAGAQVFQQSSATFFSGMGATSFQFDPKVFYDRVHGRYVLVFLEKANSPQVSKLLVAVSDDSDPNGTWFRYRLESFLVISGANYWLDYPGFGYNKDAYVVSGNMFPFSSGSFGGVQFIVMPSAPMLTGAPVTITSLRDAGGGSAQMAEVIDPAKDVVFGVSRQSGTSLRIYAVRNLTTTPVLSQVGVTVPSHSGPAGDAESTSGRFLDTIDSRVYNASWRGGRLVTAHNYEGSNFVSTRWYEVDTGTWPTSGTPTLVQSGSINSPTVNQFCAAINKNMTGKISATFTTSSTTITANMSVTGRLPGDPLGTMGAPIHLETSPGNNYSQNRWGDYYGVDVDPVDDVTFWGVHMVVAASNNWTTVIRSWTIPGAVDVLPATYNWFRGNPQSGNLASLNANDDNFLVARAGQTGSQSEPPVQLEVEVNAPSSVVYDIDVSSVAKVNTPGLTQRVEIWNYATSQWVLLGQQPASTTKSTVLFGITGNPPDYLQGGTNRVKVKFSWLRTGATFVWPWTVSVDQVKVTVTSA